MGSFPGVLLLSPFSKVDGLRCCASPPGDICLFIPSLALQHFLRVLYSSCFVVQPLLNLALDHQCTHAALKKDTQTKLKLYHIAHFSDTCH